jgi:hypothetical protein
MKRIKLTKNQFALVSDHRFEELSQFKWQATWNSRGQRFYATRTTPIDPITGKRRTIQMHRQILGLLPGDKRDGDHIKPKQTLNNQDSNLRIATHKQNIANQRKSSNNTSGFKGTTLLPRGNCRAQMMVDGKKKYLGIRPTCAEAHKLYVAAAKQLHGEFARFA